MDDMPNMITAHIKLYTCNPSKSISQTGITCSVSLKEFNFFFKMSSDETDVEVKRSFFSKSRRKTSPTIASKRQHKKIGRPKSLQRYEDVPELKDFNNELALEKQICRILRRNNSLPSIPTICEAESNHSNPWSRKSWCKRYSLKRSQSMEWDPISALFTATTEDDLEELDRILLEFEIELNFLGPAGISPLHTAALVGSTRALQLLLNSGAEIDFQDSNNQTSLEIALLAGNFDCAALLIQNGACMCKIVDGINRVY